MAHQKPILKLRLLPWLPLLLLVLALACALPSFGPGEEAGQPVASAPAGASGLPLTATLPPAPTLTPQPLPPTLLEAQPAPGSVLPQRAAMRLYFNQSMERASVEAALSGQPALAGSFNWLDDATVEFRSDVAFLPGSDLLVSIANTAQAANGLTMLEPVEIRYQVAGPMAAIQVLPAPQAQDSDPTAPVLVAYDQPVVPLGADPAGLPQPFTIEPALAGQGEWLNTSTYVFYPEPAMTGGQVYTISLSPSLQSAAGSSLSGLAEAPGVYSWSFTTAPARLVSANPVDGSIDLPLDSSFQLTFSQPMDPQSVQANFGLYDPAGLAVAGEFGWDTAGLTLTFTPTQLLERDGEYSLLLLGTAQAQGGNQLGQDHAIQVQTVPALAVQSTTPVQDGLAALDRSLAIRFNGPIDPRQREDYISISPRVPDLYAWWNAYDNTLHLNGDFKPLSEYVVVISAGLPDPYGGRLGQEYVWRFSTGPYPANLVLQTAGQDVLLLPNEPGLAAQATNLGAVDLSLGSVPLADLGRFLGSGGYEVRSNYVPADVRTWQQSLDLPGDQLYDIELSMTPDGDDLAPGVYLLRVNAPALAYAPSPYLLVSSQHHLTLKVSATQVFVWAIDLLDDTRVAGAPVRIYSPEGELLAEGRTDKDGIFQQSIGPREDAYGNFYAIMGSPGSSDFALSISSWNGGLQGYELGLPVDYSLPGPMVYLYTDRPIYRPGQTVYFRAVVRQEEEARYSLPEWQTIPLTITDGNYNVLAELELPLSPFGTASGTYQIPAGAQPGYFGIQALTAYLGFQVAEYRKPEIDLQVTMEPDQVLSGQALSAQVAARYFFDAPAAGLPLEWRLYARQDWLALPGYSVGDQSPAWTVPFWMAWNLGLGEALASGSGRTGPDGLLQIDLPAQTVEVGPQQLILEVTVRDESEFPLSARTEADLHPAEFYIGIRPDQWIGQAERELGYQIQVVDWFSEPAGARDLTAVFSKVTWLRQDPPNPYAYPTYTPQYTPVSQVDFFTGPDGVARLGFIPPEAGTYQLEVSGSGARSTSLVWVGGAGQAAWPRLPNDRLELVSDRDNYQPGDTATVFIPNPLGADGRVALVTIERGQVLRHQVLTLAENGTSLEIELTEADAPNVYLAVTLIGQDSGRPAFRQGYLELVVAPQPLVLNVALTAEPQRTGPQGEVTFDIRVSDAAGQPVTGEFSLAVVDAAVLALAEPNAPDIVSAFYGRQPLRVRTALGLAVYAQRLVYGEGGLGGGGDGDMIPPLREDFQDTAFWDAQIVTDANGQAQVSVTLPDNLTTWQVLLRGLTADTRVGEALSQVITTKDLLVRPVTPRFVVLGDHLRLASVVHNNTAGDLTATVNLAAAGFVLDDPNQESQTVTIPAGGRVVVYWWGTVSYVPALDLIFSARSGDLQDATRPVWGELPVLRYTAPQTYATAGTLTEGGQRLEVVSLPRSFDPTAGELRLQLSPSLAAAIEAGLEVLEHYPYECTEQTLSRFLPNLETYRAIQELGLPAPALQARLERTLAEGVARLVATQNADGGWSWWPGGSQEQASDEYITAYVLFGLSRARQAGVTVDGTVLQAATDFLLATLPSLEMLSSNWQFDRLAFVHFALVQAGSASQAGVLNLYAARDRLSPAGQAFLAMSLEAILPGDNRARSLVDNLEAGALRTATGAHWQGNGVRLNLDSPLFNSAVVVYALAQFDPASPTLAEAVRYLMANRDVQGAWQTTYQTAWVILALNEVMQATGELAGDFAFSASLNGQPWLQGSAGGDARLNPIAGAVPLNSLYPADPNGLLIERQPGPGRLYYSAYLEVSRPVEQVEPLGRGINILRQYDLDAPDRMSISGQPVTVRVIFTLAQDSYHLVVEDYIPAGAEILDTSLQTSQLGADQSARPAGWGGWYFNAPLIFDDHIAWTADYLPAGTYELSYTLVPTQPGEYRVLPARAWEFYFPEVQGSSAGAVVTIEE